MCLTVFRGGVKEKDVIFRERAAIQFRITLPPDVIAAVEGNDFHRVRARGAIINDDQGSAVAPRVHRAGTILVRAQGPPLENVERVGALRDQVIPAGANIGHPLIPLGVDGRVDGVIGHLPHNGLPIDLQHRGLRVPRIICVIDTFPYQPGINHWARHIDDNLAAACVHPRTAHHISVAPLFGIAIEHREDGSISPHSRPKQGKHE